MVRFYHSLLRVLCRRFAVENVRLLFGGSFPSLSFPHVLSGNPYYREPVLPAIHFPPLSFFNQFQYLIFKKYRCHNIIMLHNYFFGTNFKPQKATYSDNGIRPISFLHSSTLLSSSSGYSSNFFVSLLKFN